MIIRTARDETEIAEAIELFFINEPPPNAAYKTSALDHWKVLFADSPEAFWLAQDEATQQIVGVASAVRRPPQWLLSNFYVLPAYHGQGIGRALLARAYAAHEDCDRFAVHASTHHSAQSLYLQFGMYPLPYSIEFTGTPHHQEAPSELTVEARPIDTILSTVDSLDCQMLGFSRVVDHLRWGAGGSYFLAKAEDRPVGYFRVSPQRRIGPLVVSDSRWMEPALALAIQRQWELAPGEQEIFVPGANTSALTYLLSHGFHIQELNLLLSSHPMPGLAHVVFHDTDFL